MYYLVSVQLARCVFCGTRVVRAVSDFTEDFLEASFLDQTSDLRRIRIALCGATDAE